jgi:hypothetical protein
MKAAIYARVSTLDQEPENQLAELRRYVEARGWTLTEYVDRGVSGAKDRRPALDRVVADAKRRRFDVLVCWRLDRLGRSLKHLITLLDELQTLGVSFVSLAEGIDATTPAGKLSRRREAGAPLQTSPRPVIYVLDTNAVSALMKGSVAFVERLASHAPGDCTCSFRRPCRPRERCGLPRSSGVMSGAPWN